MPPSWLLLALLTSGCPDAGREVRSSQAAVATPVVATWKQVSPGPGVASDAALAYDSKRGRVILFGGDNFDGQTWEWDATSNRWSAVAGTGPPPRVGHAMAYDAARDRVVLFGGSSSLGNVGDTWEWNGATRTWAMVSTTGPIGRLYAAMAYHPDLGAVVLFGGSALVAPHDQQSDTWMFDQTGWHQIVTPGPSGRSAASMVYDATSHKIVLVGGGVGVGDTWEWDAQSRTWAQVATVGPASRFGQSAAFDSSIGAVVLYGGSTGPGLYPGDTWRWDSVMAQWNLLAVAGPTPARYRHRMVADEARGQVVLFGGYGGGATLGDTWLWSGVSQAWTRASSAGPSARPFHALAADSYRGKVVLFGGVPNVPMGDTWEWDGSTRSWALRSTTGPAARWGHSLSYDSAERATILFGGSPAEDDSAVGDTWRWNGDAGTWTQVANTGPSARFGHAAVYDKDRHKVVLFGGAEAFGTRNRDTWEWDTALQTWTLRSTTGPAGRYGHQMAYDATRGRVVLYGGTSTAFYLPSGRFHDTWEWDGSTGTWTDVTSLSLQHPTPALGHSMDYDPARQRVVLFGGLEEWGVIGYNETWEWNGAQWTLVTSDGPSARYHSAIAYDAVRRRLVLFGGDSPEAWRSDTWEYYVRGGACTGGWQCDTGACVDGTCCESSSCGTCERCDTAAKPGICQPVSDVLGCVGNDSCVDPDSCAGQGRRCEVHVIANGEIGVCGLVAASACTTASQCASGFCVDGVCCESACTGACQQCDLATAPGLCAFRDETSTGRGGACGAYTCSGSLPTCQTSCVGDADCALGFFCDPIGVCMARLAQGAACDTRGAGQGDCLVSGCRECQSGHCVDGVCCDAACEGGCQACAVGKGAQLDGTCASVGEHMLGRDLCGLYLCGPASTCPASCDADADCKNGGAGVYCIDGQCQGTLPNGLACTAGTQCGSGHCIDGVCCDTACEGECVACDEPELMGTCAPTTVTRAEDCVGEATCRGACQGTTVAQAHCEYPSVQQRCGLCLVCDGRGACSEIPPMEDDASCPVVSCDELQAAECWRYEASGARCLAAGVCASASEHCHSVLVDDGTTCSTGVCSAGECVSTPPSLARGCQVASATDGTSQSMMLWAMVALIAIVTRRRLDARGTS